MFSTVEIGSRGSFGAIENTKEAFIAAIQEVMAGQLSPGAQLIHD